MKSVNIMKIFQQCGRGLVASAVLSAGIACAADSPATDPNRQGSGGSRLSGNSESTQPGGTQSGSSMHSGMPRDAKTFIREAIEGNSAEIALAQVAERKAQSAELKQFAQMIQKDHQQANQQLQSLAQAHGVSASQPLSSKHQKKMDRLQQMSGAEFDREYAKEMLKDHQKDIAKYEQASKHVTETDVQQYVQATLPKLRQHLQHAQQAARSVGVDQATISSIMSETPSMGGSDDAIEKPSGMEKSKEHKMHDRDM